MANHLQTQTTMVLVDEALLVIVYEAETVVTEDDEHQLIRQHQIHDLEVGQDS